VIAGRDTARLTALADEHGGLPVARADVADPASVRALVERGDVLVTTVGPFTRRGGAALEAALDGRAHYVDSTGEAAFIREVFAAGSRAQAAGAALLTAFGFDFVPGNLAGALAVAKAGAEATRLDVAYFVHRASASSGTRASAMLIAGQRAHALRGGRVVETAFGRRARSFTDGSRSRPAILLGGTESLALQRVAPQLREISTYLGMPPRAVPALRAVSYATPVLARVPFGRGVIDGAGERAMQRTGQGPDAGARARSGCTVMAVASDSRGRELATVRMKGPDPYDLTGALMADAAIRLASGEITGTGALGPVDAYGLEALEEACAMAGFRVVD
jgi:short subunit dehydrogenase-like uncharacterized protein